MSVYIKNLTFQDNGKVIISTGGSTPAPVGGSALFDGSTTNLTIAGSSDFAPGGDDFTIEWFQYQKSTGTAPRPFSIGGFPDASIAVSLEEGTMYLWAGGQAVTTGVLNTYVNVWTHFAVCRLNNTVNVYQNGVSIASGDMSSFNITDASTTLSIGSEYQTSAAGPTFFDGDITNFRWTDAAVYSGANITVPTSPLTVGPNTKLLLLETNSAGLLTDATGNHTVTNTGPVVWDNVSPF